MPEPEEYPAVYEDAGPLAARLRALVPVLPGPRVARVIAGLGCLAAGCWLGHGAAVAGVVLFAALAVPEEATPSPVWWLVPALLRAGEYGLVVGLAARAGGGGLPAAYGLLVALSFHHYDLVYRIRYARLTPPRWLADAGGGFETRMLVVAALAAAGETALRHGLTVVACYLAVLFVAESTAAWVRWLRSEAA